MITTNETKITKVAANKLAVTREFDAPLELVWRAWTESDLLDQWWAPKPWKAHTKSMDFRDGGRMLYYMEGPDGTRHWCRFDYEKIEPLKSFSGEDGFCDENGNVNQEMPEMHWNVKFSHAGRGTLVQVDITFASEADLEKIVEMGFKEGFTAAHGNLDELLSKES